MNKLLLVSTGLGRVKRGFETHILDLADILYTSEIKDSFIVAAGARLNKKYSHVSISNIQRSNRFLKRLGFSTANLFRLEQITFFASLCFFLLKNKNIKVIYLGEYLVYCWLFKFRKLTGKNFSLCLHTGGMATPGLFDNNKDFVHHITPYYIETDTCKRIPEERQFLIPHILQFSFTPNQVKVDELKTLAGKKQIWLSVGSVDIHFKRMHIIPELLKNVKEKVFPIIVGENHTETPIVKAAFESVFGSTGYLITKCSREELASYYSAADYFILCTKAEPFGIVFLEALYFNLQIICNDNPISKYILNDQAIYLDLNDLSSSERQIEELVKINKRTNGKEYVKDRFSSNKLAANYINMFRTMLIQ